MKAILYCRVSSEKQVAGTSLESQEELGRAYAKKNGIDIAHAFVVDESASSRGRKVFNQAMGLMRSRKDIQILLFAKADRSARNLWDMAAIDELAREYGKEIHFFQEGTTYSATSGLGDFYRFGFQGIMNAGFSRDLSEKVKLSHLQKVKRGAYVSLAPFGYKNDRNTRNLAPDPDAAPWVYRIKELASQGQTVDQICQRLRTEGCPRKMSRSQIHRIAVSQVYSGVFSYSGQVYRGSYESIVPADLHESAVRALCHPDKAHPVSRFMVYRGLIHCGACGHMVTGEVKKNGKYVFYGCAARGRGCPNPSYIEEREIDAQIGFGIDRMGFNEQIALALMSDLEQDAGQEAAARVARVATLRAEEARLRGRLDKAYDDKLDGTLPEQEWLSKSRQWREKLTWVEKQILNLEQGQAQTAKGIRRLLELLELLRNQFGKMTPAQKAAVVGCLCSNILLNGKTISFVYEEPWEAFGKTEVNENWCDTLDGVRTARNLQKFFNLNPNFVDSLYQKLGPILKQGVVGGDGESKGA